ncbi:hypothetical protein [Mycobacterium sp. SMC-4]|uniref:hypothetical protein n=1 Tax=Mycobacterium sp. SMC-4 TaxID=2857059 RepID=UPI0021B1A814|nr:hypothetical protein [Mycobacterium sp. SMC-4]UXA19549.1 hypothetical protein KXD98_08105 [Mycobacterium sp. SMC-4]
MSYTVVEEFVILRDGGVVHHKTVGSEVELTVEEAAALVAAGKVTADSTAAVPLVADGVAREMSEAAADGSWTEISSEDSDGSYEALPEIDSYPEDATPLEVAEVQQSEKVTKARRR